MILARTSYSATEPAAPGEGRGGGIGGGAPYRYGHTAPGYCAISPWVNSSYTYSLLQLNIGSNPNSRLEVVSQLNLFNQACAMYHYNYQNCTSRYYPRVYIGTSQTIAAGWNYDYQKGINHPSTWPEKKPQKGEANKKVKHQFTSLFTLY